MAKKSFGLKLLDGFLALFGVVEEVTVEEVTRSLYARDGKHRVGVYRRSDGTFFFQEDVFSDKILDMKWQPSQVGPKDGCASQEEALAAARKALPWLWEIPE
jgi:hypothetical protein